MSHPLGDPLRVTQNDPIPTVNGSSSAATLTQTTVTAVLVGHSGSMETSATDRHRRLHCLRRLSTPPTRPGPDVHDPRRGPPPSAQQSRAAGPNPLPTRQACVHHDRTTLPATTGRTTNKIPESFAARPTTDRPDSIIAAILTNSQAIASASCLSIPPIPAEAFAADQSGT
jgi:hypothetical protein